jgi:hypothetical protein
LCKIIPGTCCTRCLLPGCLMEYHVAAPFSIFQWRRSILSYTPRNCTSLQCCSPVLIAAPFHVHPHEHFNPTLGASYVFLFNPWHKMWLIKIGGGQDVPRYKVKRAKIFHKDRTWPRPRALGLVANHRRSLVLHRVNP